MAYKFQIGNFRSGGNIQMAGGTSLSGSITNSIPDDATVDAIVSELDNDSLQAHKLALDTNGGLQAQNISSVERLQIKLSGGAEPGLSGLATTAQGLGIRLSASSPSFGDSGLSMNPSGLFVSINGQEGLITASGRLQVQANANKSIEKGAAGVGVVLASNKGLDHDGSNGLEVVTDGAKAMEVSSQGVAVKLRADKGLGFHADGLEVLTQNNSGVSVGAGGLTAVVDGDALQLGATGIDLKDSIAGNRTFTGTITVDGDVNCNVGNVALFAGAGANTITVGANNSTVAIAGNLSVAGTTTTVNSDELLIKDKIIQVAKDANDQATSKDSGILFGQGNANGARWLYEIDGESNQVFSAKQGSGNQLIRISAAEFMGPATQGAILDEESVNADRLILFVDGTGARDFKSDGDLKYNSSNGRLTATQFAGDGSNLTNLPLGMFPVSNKNATAGVVALQSMAYNILGNGGQGNGTHKFQVQGSYANGDEVRIKAPSDAASNRVYQITASAAYTFDGQSTLNLASPDTAITLVYVGGNQFKIF